MKKIVFAAFAIALVNIAFAQTDSTIITNTTTTTAKTKKDWSKVNLANRANDHFVFQIGYDGWAQVPDSIKTKGIGRHLNIYFMLDFPFKTNPHFSVGLGAGIGSSSIYFDRQSVGVAGTGSRLEFKNLDSLDHFKKYKLATTYVEAPIELRYVSNPENTNKSWKASLGLKLGLLLNAHTKGKKLEDKNGNTINNYTEKESSKRFFNSTRFAATARVGYGFLSLYGAYQLNTLIKSGAGPEIRPFSIGITISGL